MKKQYILCLALIPLLASCGNNIDFDKLSDVEIYDYSNEVNYETFIDAYNVKVASNVVLAEIKDEGNSFKLNSRFAQFIDRTKTYSEDSKNHFYESRFKNYDMKYDNVNKILRNDYNAYYQNAGSGGSEEDFCVRLVSNPQQYELKEDGMVEYYEEYAHTVSTVDPVDYNAVLLSLIRSTFLNDVVIVDELEDYSYLYPLSSYKSLEDDQKVEYKFFIDDEYLTIEFNHVVNDEDFKFNEKCIEQYVINENEFTLNFKDEVESKVTNYFFQKAYTESKIKTLAKSSLSKADVTLEKLDPTGFVRRN